LSKVAIEGNSSGTGTFTIASPNSNTNHTLDLPDASGVIDRLNRAGNVLQVVQGSTSTAVTNSTNVAADTGLSASITPSSASNKILVLVTHSGCNKSSGGTQSGVTINLVRGATTILTNAGYAVSYTGTNLQLITNISFAYLDSPSTTSSTTYKTQFKNNSNTASVTVQIDSNNTSTITLLEIAA